MKELKSLNKRTAPKSVMPEKIIQFGEGNFLRAFVDWIVWNMNKKTDFNGSVVVVQPLAGGMVDWLNGQDCLYHVNLQGKENGQAINTLERIDVISRALNPYSQNQAFMALAEQPEMRFIISNTTEAGIAFDDSCKFTDAPAASYPGKLVQLLFHRYKFFEGDPTKGMILMPCELIFLNGHHLKECIYQYIELWKGDMGADYEGFKEWFTNHCYVCATLVDRIVPGFPRDTIKEIQQKVCYKDNLVVKAESFHLWVIEKAENMTVEQIFTSLMKEPWGYVAVGILAPLAEEVVFRGAILRTLMGIMSKKNHWVAIMISAAIFGVVHANLAQFVNALLMGLLLGWMYYRTKSLVPGILLHWVNNTMAYVLTNIMPQSDGKLIDLFHGDEKTVYYAVGFSLCIMIPSFIQMILRLQKNKAAS